MNKYFERFSRLMEDAEAGLTEEAFLNFLDDVNRVSGDKYLDGKIRINAGLMAGLDRLAEERRELAGVA